jgi:hypothetical protein
VQRWTVAPFEHLESAVDAWWPGGAEVGVGETLGPGARAVPSDTVLRTLGPRPLAPDAHHQWLIAARALERGRASTGREAPRSGVARLAGMSATELAAYVEMRGRHRLDPPERGARAAHSLERS